MSTSLPSAPLEGGCVCGTIRYRLDNTPLIVHCCHCTWCQRETGSAFVLNAMIESKYLTILSPTKPFETTIESASGKGQDVARCPKCYIACWSFYGSARHALSFVKVGTLDKRQIIEPEAHIFTSTKMDWVDLSSPKWDGKIFEEFYDREKFLDKGKQDRFTELIAEIRKGMESKLDAK